ncbi:MAG: lysophospholipid acyltransferase family protein [Caldilineaceae bacterium]
MKEYNAFTERPWLQYFFRTLMRLWGWKVKADFPDIPQYVLIFAHHTSNWDFVIGLFAALSISFWPQWIGKDSLFKPPFGGFMRWLGGVPVVRSSRSNFVDQVVEIYRQSNHFIIAIAPEGTRGKTDHWKTGFYHIAQGANVPILMSYLNYRTKTAGIGPLLYPSGDLEKDLAVIREFYAGISGKHPENQGEVQLRSS